METSQLALILSALALLLSGWSILNRSSKETPTPATSFEMRPLQLQAYERLVLLTERMSLPNLISRLNQPGISATEMKVLLIENIKQEFDYNSTQQLYVSDIAWDSIRNLKEQNLALIHQVSASLPVESTGLELNKRLLELMLKQSGIPMHEIVAKTLNKEAKTLMS